MTAMNQEQARTYSELDEHNPIAFSLQKASTVIHTNAVCTKLAGKAQPAVANTAGQTLLGFSVMAYTANNTDTPWTPPMVFKQGCGALFNDAADPVTFVDVGSDVYLSDDTTVHHTNGGNDVPVRCKWIEANGTVMCEVTNK